MARWTELRSAAALAAAALLALAAMATAAQLPPAADMLPFPGEGVVLVGEPAVYRGEELFDYIDGGAPQFLEYGFIEAATQEVRYHERAYVFDVYRLRDPLAAFGVFSVRRPAGAPPLGMFAYSSRAPYQCLLAYGPYYIEIVPYEVSAEALEEIEYLARRGTAALDPSRAPRNLTETSFFRALPAEGRVAGSERLARGPVSARTALAAAPGGAWREAHEAILERLFPPGSPPDPAPFWQVVDYHPARAATEAGAAGAGGDAGVTEGDSGAAAEAMTADSGTAPATTLVRISGLEDPRSLLAIAHPGGGSSPDPTPLPGGAGWIAYDDEKGHGFARLRAEGEILMGGSRLPREKFTDWVLSLGNEPETRR
ncbi:MAG: hypothetical protein FJY75_11160 [Candidatus Eisenbacteria bacterium]|uniref:Uncharacterized protein n=1 Tax=Eiseniibacteriota bacterium TaxID=2212470 RepID=A0A937X9I7_UNCEI|nr:hypothetical protein [Candidatus Eisenbacteria bacterium]